MLSLIPVREVTAYEHKQAVDRHNAKESAYHTEDGFAIFPDDNDDTYTAGYFHTTVSDYDYIAPSEFGPGAVLDYMGKTPVKAKLKNGISVIYPYGEKDGEKIPADEYFKMFSKYDYNNFYSVVVENGVITEIECVFHP